LLRRRASSVPNLHEFGVFGVSCRNAFRSTASLISVSRFILVPWPWYALASAQSFTVSYSLPGWRIPGSRLTRRPLPCVPFTRSNEPHSLKGPLCRCLLRQWRHPVSSTLWQRQCDARLGRSARLAPKLPTIARVPSARPPVRASVNVKLFSHTILNAGSSGSGDHQLGNLNASRELNGLYPVFSSALFPWRYRVRKPSSATRHDLEGIDRLRGMRHASQ
jgi:hypothetical protein